MSSTRGRMLRVARAAVVALLLFGSAPDRVAVAGDEPVPTPAAEALEVARKIQERYDGTENFTAAFTQELTVSATGFSETSTGNVSFQKPGRMRWVYEEPEPQIIISDGKTLWVHQPEDKQVLRAPIEDAFNSSTPVSFLFGVARLERDFEPKIIAASGPGVRALELEPKAESDAPLGQLVIEVDEETWDLRAAIVIDPLGNRTRVELTSFARNEGVDESLFQFERPPGTDLIERPGR